MGKDSSIMTSMQGFPNLKGTKPPQATSTPSKVRNLMEDQPTARVTLNTPGRLPKNGPIILRPGDDGLFSPTSRKFPPAGYAKSELGFYSSSPNKTRSDDGFGSDSSDSSNKASVLSVKTDVNRRARPLSMSRYSSIPHRGQSEDLEAKEARTNRKIMDLEISNNSLLSINASLESTIKKQTAHIEQLEKNGTRGGSQDLAPHDIPLPNWEDITLSSDEEDDNNIDLANDQGFARVCSMVDSLISDAKRSLEYKTQVNGGKVLTTFKSEENLDESYGALEESYDSVSRNLSDIEEEHELNDNKDSILNSSKEPFDSEEIGCQTEPADLTDSSTQTNVDERQIKELINQIWDLTDKRASKIKALNHGLPSSNANGSEAVYSILAQLKEALGCEEGDEKARTPLAQSNSTNPQPSNVQSRPITTRSRAPISNPSIPQSARTNPDMNRNLKKNPGSFNKTPNKATHPDIQSSPSNMVKIKTRV
ncbi:hypothetical protein K7432_000684 [Basidiobolus ranarum]|uniref:Uncharacterized protein n=1 Tax=Basidiobolus ranarum TaxID=34480 RepID=A0ABR2WAU7_9FUNG